MNRNHSNDHASIGDCGGAPLITDLERCCKANTNFRTALWTGEHLQVTLMCIPPCGEIGVEVHSCTDQMIQIVSGNAQVEMGKCRNQMCQKQRIGSGCTALIPAGTWHNIINTGNTPLKLYSVYAPPQHPFGTVHKTRADADAADCNR